MDSSEALHRLRDLIGGGNVNPIRERQDRTRTFAFFAASGKHNAMTELDWAHLGIYAETLLRTGSPFDASGIRLTDGKFLELDKAKVGAAITDDLIESANGDGTVLRFTGIGWRSLTARLR